HPPSPSPSSSSSPSEGVGVDSLLKTGAPSFNSCDPCEDVPSSGDCTSGSLSSPAPPAGALTTTSSHLPPAPHHSTQRAHTSSTRPVIIIVITPVTCVQPSAQTNAPSTQSGSERRDKSHSHAHKN
ncbi:hypothetical protein TcG_12398, partial [Trypanosoma cruzi]